MDTVRQEHVLLDYLIQMLALRNDRALAAVLEVGAPVISKIRSQRLPVSASVLLAMHEVSQVDLRTLRFLAGDFRMHTGPSAPLLKAEECAAMVESTELASMIMTAEGGTGVSTFRRTAIKKRSREVAGQ